MPNSNPAHAMQDLMPRHITRLMKLLHTTVGADFDTNLRGNRNHVMLNILEPWNKLQAVSFLIKAGLKMRPPALQAWEQWMPCAA